ncbi:MAG: periplasmic heavy metal sensor [Planctomycetota bacterium]|jgi:Spy/CpxP family protein refolding chaperone|nr:periplasmic heavy metal sensor [Planctomycetota bacterium]
MRSRNIALILALALLSGYFQAARGGDAGRNERGRREQHERRFQERRHGGSERGDREGHGRGPGLGFPGGLIMLSDLELGQEQKDRLAELLTAGFKAGLEARLEMREAGIALRRLREDDKAGEEALVAAHAALGSARGKLEAIHAKTRRDIRAVLTPEQAEKLDADLAGRPDWRHGDRGRHGGGSGCGGWGNRGSWLGGQGK